MDYRRKTREQYLKDIKDQIELMPKDVPLSQASAQMAWWDANVPPSLRREWAGTDQDPITLTVMRQRQAEEDAWWLNKLGPEPPPPPGGPEMMPEPLPLMPEQAPPPFLPPPETLPEPGPLGEQAPPPYRPPPETLPEPLPPLDEELSEPWEPSPDLMDPSASGTGRINPWAAVTIAIVLIVGAGGIALSAAGGDDESSLSGLDPAASVFDTTLASGGDPICPSGGRSRALPCPDDVDATVAVDTVLATTPVATTPVATTPVATAPPGTAALTVADYAGRWVLTSGFVDPTGLDLLWYAKDLTTLTVNPTVAEFVIDPDGQIRSGSYSASLTGQSGCGNEVWTAAFDTVSGFVDADGLGGVQFDGPVDLRGSKCFTAPKATGNRASFWITGEVAMMCRSGSPISRTECAEPWPEPAAIFQRVG